MATELSARGRAPLPVPRVVLRKPLGAMTNADLTSNVNVASPTLKTLHGKVCRFFCFRRCVLFARVDIFAREKLCGWCCPAPSRAGPVVHCLREYEQPSGHFGHPHTRALSMRQPHAWFSGCVRAHRVCYAFCLASNKKNSVCGAPCSSLTSKQRPSLLLFPLDCACTAACCPSSSFAPAPAGALSTCPSVSFFATDSLVHTIIELTASSGPVPLSPSVASRLCDHD
jgi:hypothetical protein